MPFSQPEVTCWCFSQMPENLMSRNTLKNVEKNKERIDYCVTTFSYISNRCRHFCPRVGEMRPARCARG